MVLLVFVGWRPWHSDRIQSFLWLQDGNVSARDSQGAGLDQGTGHRLSPP